MACVCQQVYRVRGCKPLQRCTKKIVDVAKQVGGNGFEDMQVSEIEELLEEHDVELTDEDLEELSPLKKRRTKMWQVNQRASPLTSWQMCSSN